MPFGVLSFLGKHMAEDSVIPFQSGNPVFDATVMIMCSRTFNGNFNENARNIHNTLLDLAAKEPGGFREALNLREQHARAKSATE